MGGAFTSIEDDVESVLYNPGCFNLYKYPKDFKVTVFMNPLMSLLAFQHYSDNFSKNPDRRDFLNATALLFKSVVISIRQFETGVVIGEESFNNVMVNKQSRVFAYNNLWNDNSNTVFMKLRLAQRVSIGVNGTYYQRKIDEKNEDGIGFSYGIVLKPNDKLNVGLSYIDLPDKMADYRVRLERIFDETMNVGMSYNLFKGTTLALDVRNLTEENKDNVREFHFGFEQRIFNILALRGGYFKERFTDNETFSAGIGLIDSNIFFSGDDKFNHHDYMINYSFVHDESREWHMFSFLWRF